MATLHWGVDSAGSAAGRLRVKGNPTLWDHVSKSMGRIPEFWGRYLFTIKDHSEGLTGDEVNFIRKESGGKCRILLVHSAIPPANFKGTFAMGQTDAKRGITKAINLGVPPGVWIYANIEPNYRVSAEWIRGYWTAMLASQFGGRGGLYVMTDEASFRAAYPKALMDSMMATWDVQEIMHQALTPGVFSQDPPQTARFLWDQFRPLTGCSLEATGFSPRQTSFAPGMTVIWQYALACLGGTCDMNFATDRGLMSMWQL